MHVPIIIATLLEPDNVVTNAGKGLAMDEVPTTIGGRVAGGGIDVGHEKSWNSHWPKSRMPSKNLA